jgi:endonuclease/exonuclease/phosphatase family metal-dependent hydrolase
VKRLIFLTVAGLLTGCQSDRLAGPAMVSTTPPTGAAPSRFVPRHSRLPAPGASGLRVMTYNIYLGTDLDPVLAAGSQADFLVAAVQAYAELQETDFPARAGKIADQIAAVRPDVVGLDEAALWSVSSPAGAPFAVQYDFLALVLDSLKARRLTYVAASADTTSDVTAPVPTAFDDQGNPTAFALVRFQDRDAILVRAGVQFRDAQHAKFAAFIPLTLLDGTHTGLFRGWCSVRATVDGRTFRFVASHLEAEDAQVNFLQAEELLGLLQNASEPVIWAGDFNAGPGVAADFEATYDLVTGSGFADLWPLARPRDPGLTNGPVDGVLVPSLSFTTRIDLILLKDRFGTPQPVHAAVFGTEQDDRTASGLWPSDHAAVGMVFDLPVRRGQR